MNGRMKSGGGGAMVHGPHNGFASKYIDIAHVVQVTSAAFTEQEIIAINDMLLSNGIHTIALKNEQIGRKIVDTFLSLLNCYQQIYWLSYNRTTPAGTINLYHLLLQEGCLKDVQLLEELLETYFYPACLVIELSHELEKQSWYKKFYSMLEKSTLLDNIPVIKLSFEC